MITRFAVVAAALQALALAQDTRFAGPSFGFVFDAPSHSVRRVAGVPGSAYLVQGAVRECDFASIAPTGKSALIVRGEQWFLVPDVAAEGEVALPDLTGIAGLAAWSPDSREAAVYIPSRKAIAAVRFGSGSESVVTWLDVESAPSALAVIKGAIFAAFEQGVFRLEQGKAPTLVIEGSGPFAFGANEASPILYVAAGAPVTVSAIRNPAGFAEAETIFSAPADFDKLVGLGLSRDGSQLFLAGGGSSHVLAVDLVERRLTGTFNWDTPPQFVQPLNAGSVFLLAGRQSVSDSIFALDARPGSPSLFFIPAGE